MATETPAHYCNTITLRRRVESDLAPRDAWTYTFQLWQRRVLG
jgi:hypothetical protein